MAVVVVVVVVLFCFLLFFFFRQTKLDNTHRKPQKTKTSTHDAFIFSIYFWQNKMVVVVVAMKCVG